MSVRIGSNVLSLRAMRSLDDASERLTQSLARLSSGLRILSPSDDAAGLSIAESLRVDSRVYSQGIRNLSDGLSMLDIAQGGLESLATIATRQMELAEQAANGTYSRQQRLALQSESTALTDEFNRIVNSLSFNGLTLLDGSRRETRLQGGYGVSGSLSIDLGREFEEKVGTGRFSVGNSFNLGSTVRDLAVGDVNGDGIDDFVSGNGSNVRVGISDGSGGFSMTTVTLSPVVDVTDLVLVDINKDGVLDIVGASTGSRAVVLTNDGTGNFTQTQSLVTASDSWGVGVGDVNGDGNLDIVTSDRSASSISTFLGDGAGGFTSGPSVSIAGGNNYYLSLGDLNQDGLSDFVVGNLGSTFVYHATGGGNFTLVQSITDTSSQGYDLADINSDGLLDMVNARVSTSGISIRLGNSNGTFAAASTLATPTSVSGKVQFVDVNNDGKLDVVSGSSTTSLYTYLGNGDGSFLAVQSSSTTQSVESFALGDFNNDGALDALSGASSGSIAGLSWATTDRAGEMPRLALMSQGEALVSLEVARDVLDRITAELGVIGTHQSRASVAARTLEITRENGDAADSRIRDSDVAAESSRLISAQILQQAAAAVLGQANQQPQLALLLLRV